MSRSFYVSDFE